MYGVFFTFFVHCDVVRSGVCMHAGCMCAYSLSHCIAYLSSLPEWIRQTKSKLLIYHQNGLSNTFEVKRCKLQSALRALRAHLVTHSPALGPGKQQANKKAPVVLANGKNRPPSPSWGWGGQRPNEASDCKVRICSVHLCNASC